MRSLWAASATLLALTSLVTADTDSSDVITLTSSSFEASVAMESLMLVQFTVPSCIRYRILAPQYEEAATALKEKNVKLAQVDCREEVELCQRNDIQRYPTLKVYKGGTPTDYTGPSTADGIAKYMIKQSLPVISEVSLANHEEFIKIAKVVIVAYLPSSDSEPARVFSAAAEDYHDYCVFGLSTDPANAEAANVKPPAIVAYRTFDEPRTEFPFPASGLSIDEIEDWLSELLEPIIDPLDSENYIAYLNSGKPLAELLLDPASEGNDKLLEALRPIAREFKPYMNFVWVDAIKFSHHGLAVNLPQAKWPAFVIDDIQQGHKYSIDQSKEITPELVSLRIEQFIRGELEPSIRSAVVPENQDGNIYILVGKNFEEVVFDDTKDVFIEFYSLWCDHCKRLEPTWNSLGDKFASLKDKITIAKMETMQNQLPPNVPFRLRGLPALKFKPAGSRDFVDYEGDQSLQSLVTFVEEHSKNAVTADDAGVVQAPMSASGP